MNVPRYRKRKLLLVNIKGSEVSITWGNRVGCCGFSVAASGIISALKLDARRAWDASCDFESKQANKRYRTRYSSPRKKYTKWPSNQLLEYVFLSVCGGESEELGIGAGKLEGHD